MDNLFVMPLTSKESFTICLNYGEKSFFNKIIQNQLKYHPSNGSCYHPALPYHMTATTETVNHVFQTDAPTRRKVLSTIFCIHELIDAHDWHDWYAIVSSPKVSRASFAPLVPNNRWFCCATREQSYGSTMVVHQSTFSCILTDKICTLRIIGCKRKIQLLFI